MRDLCDFNNDLDLRCRLTRGGVAVIKQEVLQPKNAHGAERERDGGREKTREKTDEFPAK